MRSGGFVVALLVAVPALAGCMTESAQPEIIVQSEDPDGPEPTPTTSSPRTTRTTSRTTSPPSPSSSSSSTPTPTPTPTPPPPPPPPAPPALACEGEPVIEAHLTHGSGDAEVPTLTWAVLKTGFRFVVVWQDATNTDGTLRYKVGNAGWGAASDEIAGTVASPDRQVHAIVLDGLPIGKTLCFQVESAGKQSSLHAVKLVNAMNAYDEEGQVYTANFLTIANQLPNRADLEGGLASFANRLYDATDGWVRAGHMVVLYDDPDHPHAIIAVGAPGVGGIPLAAGYIVGDIYFQYDTPIGAAYTTLDAIQRTNGYISMIQFFQAGYLLVDDVGSVLMHEMGHYMFGTFDLYNGPDCWDPSTSISVMGSAREATEFDDEINRCPDSSSVQGTYVPSYTRMRERFLEVEDREGDIDPGPYGDGGEFSLKTFDL